MWKGWDPIGDPAVTLSGTSTNTTFNFYDVNKLTVLFFSDATDNKPAFEAHFSSEIIIATTSTGGTQGTSSEGTTGGSTPTPDPTATTGATTPPTETTATTVPSTTPTAGPGSFYKSR